MSMHTSYVVEGLRRGVRELHQVVTNGEDLLGNSIWLLAMLAPVWVMREDTVAGHDLSAASFLLPSLLAMTLAFYGTFSIAQQLVGDRHDGSLLRLRAIPNGVPAYLVGKVVLIAAMVTTICLLITVAGGLLLDDVALTAARMWARLAWLVPMSLLAMLPIGAVLGVTIRQPRNVNILILPLMLLAAVSGTFAPITVLPDWAQLAVRAFPLHWIALGARSAMLPDHFAAAEVGGSWQSAQVVGVLGLWAAIGFACAPVVLRRIRVRPAGTAVQREVARA